MQEKTMLQKIFIFVAALAICVLLVLDTVALIEKFGNEKAKAVVSLADSQREKAQPNSTVSNAADAQQDSTSTSKTATAPFTEFDPFVAGAYFHELGEYGFANTALVPNITFDADGTFVFRENTGSGMGICSGTYSLSTDGSILTCSVAETDIACPDVIVFYVSTDGAIVISTSMKKTIEGDSFIVRTAQ